VSAGAAGLATGLEAAVPGGVERDVPAAMLSTYRLGGPLGIVVRVPDTPALTRIAAVVAEHGPPVLVLGRGSNVLVADAGFPGVALVLEAAFEAIELDAEGEAVRAGAAVALPVLARRLAAAGAGGLEFFVGIPGSVGGAVRMNAGGHGRETVDVLRRAWVCDLSAGQGAAVVERDVGSLALGYRTSAVGSTEVVTAAEFAVGRDDAAGCEARIDEIVRWRREHQPGGANGGSVFRNPPGDFAGRLIDATGLKGLRVGGAYVSPKHANFFGADPDATADDVAGLVHIVQERVAAETGVELVPEIHLVGFGATVAARPRSGRA
jgi:UDP-N-acetylmuramate dehydrogenase